MYAPKAREGSSQAPGHRAKPPVVTPPSVDTSVRQNVIAEKQAFKQHQFQAHSLQLKQEKGLITPEEQTTLGVLQAKMDQFWTDRLNAQTLPNLLTIPGLLSEQPMQAKADDAVIQAKFKDSAELRKEAFILKAIEFGVEVGPANGLYDLSGGDYKDPVTNLQGSEDKEPSQNLARTHVEETGQKAFYSKVKFYNLAGLNQVRGHSGADEIFAHLAQVMNNAAMSLTSASVQVYAYRHENSRFGFMFVGPVLEEAAIRARLEQGQAECTEFIRQQDLHEIPNIKHSDKPGIGINFNLYALEGGAREAPVEEDADQVEDEPLGDVRDLSGVIGQDMQGDAPGIFEGEAEHREGMFMQHATEILGLPRQNAETLYKMAGRQDKDALTQFDKAGDRLTTVLRAMEFFRAQFPDAFASYVEVDVRNLGGLNDNLSRSDSDMVFKFMAKTTEQHVKTLKADVVSFRHGGDEFSFVVVGELIDVGILGLRGVLEEASAVIRQWVEKKEVRQEPKEGFEIGGATQEEIELLDNRELPPRLMECLKQKKITLKDTETQVHTQGRMWRLIGSQTYWLIQFGGQDYFIAHVPRRLTLANILHSKDTPDNPRYPGTGIVFGVGMITWDHVNKEKMSPIDVVAPADKEVEDKKD